MCWLCGLHMDAALATWEDTEAVRQHFSGALAWGQAGFPARGHRGLSTRKPNV
jgi:hypothetical protein